MKYTAAQLTLLSQHLQLIYSQSQFVAGEATTQTAEKEIYRT